MKTYCEFVTFVGLNNPPFQFPHAPPRPGFICLDDPDYVTGNYQVLNGLSWRGRLWAVTSNHASNWHPLTWLSHMLDCQLLGVNPSGLSLLSGRREAQA